MRVKITLACTECKQRNYNTFKNKKNDRIVLSSTSTAVSAVSTLCTESPSNRRTIWQTFRK